MTVTTEAPATTATNPAETWAFGIEIECYMPRNLVFEMSEWHRGGIQIPGIEGWAAQGWKAERDGSVTTNDPGYVGIEIISPILSGEDGLTQVVCMVEWLAEIGARVDSKCGQHVSVDTRSLNDAQIENLVRAFKALQPGIFLVNGAKAAERFNSRFCAPLMSGRMDMGNRYQALNLKNHVSGPAGRRRAEFRLWAGTLDSTKTVTYILASVGLIAGVASGDMPQDVPADALGQLRRLCKQYVIGHRMLAADKVSDLTDICRHMVKTGREGQEALQALV